MKRKVVFVLLPQVELLDLAGPVQVFTEAQYQGLEIEILFCGMQQSVYSAPGLTLLPTHFYNDIKLNLGDFLFIPGIRVETSTRDQDSEKPFFEWLRIQHAKGVSICSVCNAAFILGEAGLLDGRECTTHWRSAEMMQQMYPKAKVQFDMLYIKSNNVYTSAGISSGIDLALSIIEELKGPFFTHKVARGLVVYHRRNSEHSQQSIYLNYRNHIRPEIHRVQDYLIDHLHLECMVETLAELVAMSPRNLSRVFKAQTGITIHRYVTLLRIEKAKTMKNNPTYTIEYIASQCGFKSSKQLQRLLQ